MGLRKEGTNVHLDVKAPFTSELQIDQSVAHDGVCLTVVHLDGDVYTVTAIDETLKRTHLGQVEVGMCSNWSAARKWGTALTVTWCRDTSTPRAR